MTIVIESDIIAIVMLIIHPASMQVDFMAYRANYTIYFLEGSAMQRCVNREQLRIPRLASSFHT